MCGRFVQATPAEVIAEVFGLEEVPVLSPRFNLAPTQEAAVIRVESGQRRLVWLRWGLIPFWAREAQMGQRLINARAETLAEKPAFRQALSFRRCLVPATGFYEWKQEGAGKVPFFFQLRRGGPMAFAGLWERWEPPQAPAVESFTIITTAANAFVGSFHHRMPAILPEEAWERWLDPTNRNGSTVLPLLRPAPDDWLEAVPVSRKVNNPAYDAPDCLAPVGAVRSG
ncbi:MAG: SOS response-associated peptidase [Thermoanaerobaculum sp.]|nr:SOS response-associated peptidase [Thermoanaerobaculum sp.]